MPIDYLKYPKNWKTEIVPRILKRAKNRCEICGLKNYSVVYAVRYYIRHGDKYSYRTIWFRDKQDALRECLGYRINTRRVVLTVAHLDHDETNHNVKNDRLKAMCQVCHLRYDAKEKMRRVCEKQGNIPLFSLSKRDLERVELISDHNRWALDQIANGDMKEIKKRALDSRE